MCLVLFAYRAHRAYPLVLAANRDEFYHRPTAAMDRWADAPSVLAGRDLEAGGTWFGITPSGRLAAVTNVRDPASVRAGAPSRGALVSDFLAGRSSPTAYLGRVAEEGDRYNGFNLLVGDPTGLYYYSNRDAGPRSLEPGIHGLSNHLLNTPWPKVERGRQGLSTLLDGGAPVSAEAVLTLLEDPTPAPDTELPATGVPLVLERLLSSMFIRSPEYGTRASTVLLVDATGGVSLTEKSHPDGAMRRFSLSWPPLADP